LQELRGGIDSSRDRLEAWRADLFIKMLLSVDRVCHDLLQTTEQEALPAAAWNARNLLELLVWIKYCSASRANAWRFHEDALRDALGLTESLSKMCELAGVKNEFEASARKKVDDLALEKLGVKSIDSNYERVSNAAKCVGLDDLYNAWNKHLSKFAHPTALLVIGIMHQTGNLGDFQSVCTTDGVYLAGQCVIALEQMIAAIP